MKYIDGKPFDGGRTPGVPRHPDTVAKIKATTIAQRSMAELEFPSRRRCATCGEWKVTGRDFSWRHRKLSSGVVRYAPYPSCKDCEARRARERRAKWSKEEKQRVNRHRRDLRKVARRRDEASRKLLVDGWDVVAWLGEAGRWERLKAVEGGKLVERLRGSYRWHRGKVTWRIVVEVCDALGEGEAAWGLYPVVSDVLSGA